jgi:U32 family peptidase
MNTFELPAAPPRLEPGGPRSRLPELLAPAGDWDCARAAVENGADAIYFGLEKFNARMRAHNFSRDDLPKLMEFLHRRGVKGYVTFNTLVFENEMAAAEEHLRDIIAAGVDAAIVQDVGICRLIRSLSPDFPIHVSTQMTVTSAAGVEFARELGCQLVVLARECSLKEIETIRSAAPELPLEVFVHGALCVAYSGQCLTSESLGGRSANRGVCAQACRLPYELISDGQAVPLGDRKYLLSPQDLAGLELLPDLVRSGITSLKIEGRLKSPEYVADITRIYRQALDGMSSGRADARQRVVAIEPDSVAQVSKPAVSPISPPSLSASARSRRSEAETDKSANRTMGVEGHESGRTVDCQSPGREGGGRERYEMEMAFSRGLYTGWFRGINNQELVHARFGKKRGVYLGEIAGVEDRFVRLTLQSPLKAGDGVVFDSGHPEEDEEGGRVYTVEQRGSGTWLSFGPGVNLARLHRGDKLWKTSDPELDRRLRQTFEGDNPKFQRSLSLEVRGAIGEPLSVVALDEQGNEVRAKSAMPLSRADKQPLTPERLHAQLGRLGGTPFILGQLICDRLEGSVLLPVSELNRLRRVIVDELLVLRSRPKRWTLNGRDIALRCPRPYSGRNDSGADVPALTVLVRSLPQLEATLNCGIQTIYCEFEDPKKYRDAVLLFRARTPNRFNPSTLQPFNAALSQIYVAPPRIFKSGEEWILKQVRSCEADGYLVRNYDHLQFFKGDRCIGDYSLNVANSLTADYFKNQFRLERITASYDLNFEQLEALLRGAPPEWFEITIHQYIPMFHMEHCVFCAFLSSGTDYSNCGRPCDKHDVQLRDRVGASHPLKADAGCRNTVFNAMAQTGADYVPKLLSLGARHFRLEFLNETPGQLSQTVERYRQLLRGEITGPELWRELKLLNQLGVTRGTLAKG